MKVVQATEKPRALKREHPALQNLKLSLFSSFVGHLFPLGSESDPAGQNQRESMRLQIHNTAKIYTNIQSSKCFFVQHETILRLWKHLL